MGKAKRQLNEARKEIFSEISRKYENETYSDQELDTYTEEEDVGHKIIELSYDIRETLFKYVDDVGYPLCEYLDMDNMINYVEWLLKPHL